MVNLYASVLIYCCEWRFSGCANWHWPSVSHYL